MRKIGSALAFLIVGLFLVSFIAVPANAVTTPITAWDVGDKWAMGKEMDIGANFTDMKGEIEDMIEGYLNLTVNKLDVDGTACFYVLFEVTSETATTYIVTSKVAMKLDTKIDVSVSGMLPAAGTYSYSDNPFNPDSTVAKQSKTVTVDVTEKLGVVMTTTAIVQKSSHAVSNITMQTNGAFCLEVDAINIPNVNSSSGQQVLSYKNYDLGVKACIDLTMYMDFSPALDLFQLPVMQGELWYTNSSTMTMSGQVTGFVDAHGLEDEWKESIFTEEFVEATGSSDFPINLDKLNSEDANITNGHFGPVTNEIPPMKMRCLSTSVTHEVNGVSKEYLVIEVNDAQKILYCPTLGFMCGGAVSTETDDMPVELPEGTDMFTGMLGDELSMDPLSADSVAGEISSIESYTSSVEKEATGGSSIADFFFSSPYLGTLMVIGAAACIGIILYVGTRGRKPGP
jgi:hypothetical protein